MIRVRLSDGSFIFGIDAENVRRLKDDQPLVMDTRPMGGHDVVFVMYGETKAQIMKELAAASGRPLPPATPWPDDDADKTH